MDTSFLHNILEESGFGSALLTTDWRIASVNKYFTNFSISKIHPEDAPVQTFYPETVGLEAIFEQLAAGERQSFKLENLNREMPDESLQYFSLAFFHMHHSNTPVLCTVEDATPKAVLNQQLYQ
ncbi:MAG: hypothetical protein AAFP70_03840, partial [Calditrichota bacterium]